MKITTEMPFKKSQAQPEVLTFREEDIHRTQARLKGRTALIPEIDLNTYRFHAVIDWVKLRFVVGRNTQFQYVQGHIEQVLGRKCFVTPIGAGPGRVSDTFEVTFQEPASIQALLDLCDKVEDAYGLKSRPEVVGLEVSVDAYPSKPSDSARAQILGVMQRTIFTDRDIWSEQNDRPRFVFGSIETVQDDGRADEGAGAKTARKPSYITPGFAPEKAAGRSAFDPEHFETTPVDGKRPV